MAKVNKKTDGLTKRQIDSLNKHKKHHTKKHMDLMKKLMREGKSFDESHNMAMKKVGK
mgnify:CR=1 FL=1|jgi:hypothetical protein|tara:strand:+ start:86 stop:259 length:174 start_codon:yes stop_codon:yes gene_type:complete